MKKGPLRKNLRKGRTADALAPDVVGIDYVLVHNNPLGWHIERGLPAAGEESLVDKNELDRLRVSGCQSEVSDVEEGEFTWPQFRAFFAVH